MAVVSEARRLRRAQLPLLTRGLLTRISLLKMIRAIFFDFNGVIIDDERIHLKAYREVLNGEGLDFSDNDYFACLGMDDVAFVRAAYARADKTVTDEKTREVIDREHLLHRQLISEDLPVSAGLVTLVKTAAPCYALGLVCMAERTE